MTAKDTSQLNDTKVAPMRIKAFMKMLQYEEYQSSLKFRLLT